MKDRFSKVISVFSISCHLLCPCSAVLPGPLCSERRGFRAHLSFLFFCLFVSASKKPLPPTPEDNRVSEGLGGPQHCRPDGHLPVFLTPGFVPMTAMKSAIFSVSVLRLFLASVCLKDHGAAKSAPFCIIPRACLGSNCVFTLCLDMQVLWRPAFDMLYFKALPGFYYLC